MDEVTQQNAALVEEAAAASESLQSQAEQLAVRVSSFKLDDSAVAQPVKRSSKKLPHAPAAKARQAAPKAALGKKIKAASADEDEWEDF
jgi:methyl-accepting chemotaxis protein